MLNFHNRFISQRKKVWWRLVQYCIVIQALPPQSAEMMWFGGLIKYAF